MIKSFIAGLLVGSAVVLGIWNPNGQPYGLYVYDGDNYVKVSEHPGYAGCGNSGYSYTGNSKFICMVSDNDKIYVDRKE